MPELVRVAAVGNLATAANLQTVNDFVDTLETSLTPARGAFLDRLAIIAAGGAGELTAARAALLTNLDAAISGRASAANLTTAQTDLTTLIGRITAGRATDWDTNTATLVSLLARITAGRATDWDTNTATLVTLLARLSAVRAGYLDVLNAEQNGMTGVPILYPANAAAVAPTSGTPAFTLGAYTQVVAAVTGLLGLSGVYHTTNSEAIETIIEIAQGAAASEVVVWRGRVKTQSATADAPMFFPIWPYIRLTSGVRLAVRTGTSIATHTCSVAVQCVPLPLA